MSTSFLDDKFYEKATDRLVRIETLIDKCNGDVDFLVKLMVILRQEWNMRTTSHVIAGRLVTNPDLRRGNTALIRDALVTIWQRPDDMVETFAYWLAKNALLSEEHKKNPKKNMPKVLKVAIKKYFERRLKPYQASKYEKRNIGKQLTLARIMRLTHPKPRGEAQTALFKQIYDGTLPPAKTWETVMSTQGSTTENWAEQSTKMGYMATLKNLRNFEKHGVPLEPVAVRLADRERVLKSRQLPFRFMTALDHVTSTTLKKAIRTAVEHAVSNLVLPQGNILVALDTSSSMNTKAWQRQRWDSTVEKGGNDLPPIQHAALLGSALIRRGYESEGVMDVVTFDSELGIYDGFDKGMLAIRNDILRSAKGGATNLYLVYEWLKTQTKVYDFLIIFTDMQFSDLTVIRNYRYHFGDAAADYDYSKPPKNVKQIICFDMNGYDKTMNPHTPNGRIITISGWSEKIFDYMSVAGDPLGMVKTIKARTTTELFGKWGKTPTSQLIE